MTCITNGMGGAGLGCATALTEACTHMPRAAGVRLHPVRGHCAHLVGRPRALPGHGLGVAPLLHHAHAQGDAISMHARVYQSGSVYVCT